MKKNRGMVLILILIIFQLIAMIGLYSINMAWIEIKASQFLARKHVAFNLTEKALRKAEENLELGLPNCIIPIIETDKLLAQSLKWWQTNGSCKGNLNSLAYYYVIELIETDPCVCFEKPDMSMAKYFRITLLGVMDTIKIVLQSTFVPLPIHQIGSPECPNNCRSIVSGRQMWREMRIKEESYNGYHFANS